MQLVTLYPFDPTGRASANRIENQSIVVTPPTEVTDYSYVVPRAAPFYADSLVVKSGTGSGARTLVENVDYWCVIDFLSASIALNKRVSVGIALLDPSYSGTLYVTYQAVGGNYTLADYSILEELIRKRHAVKHVSYEQIVNLPPGFAPEWHRHQVGDMVGMSQVVGALGGIKIALEGRQGSYAQLNSQIGNHVNSVSGAHTPLQVGLGNVQNYSVATMSDAAAGASNKYITAAILKQYVTGQGTDTSGFLTSTSADLRYVVKNTMTSYQTTAQADSKYALKSDVYTKSQVDGILSDFSGSNGGDAYYSKIQSDARYLLKTDVSSFISTTTAAATFVSKLTLNDYQTTVQSDFKYPLKPEVYTRAQSDERYAMKTSLASYLSTSDGDNRYQSKTGMSNYYTKLEVNKHKVTSGNLAVATTSDYNLSLTSTLADASAVDVSIPINLSNHPKKTEVYTRLEVDTIINELRAASKTYHKGFDTVSNYQGIVLPVTCTLVYCLSTGALSIHAVCNKSFYFSEGTAFRFTTGPAPNVVPGLTATNPPAFMMTGGNAKLNANADFWVAYANPLASFTANGELSFELTFSYEGASAGSYVDKLMGSTTIMINSLNDHRKAMQWFTPEDAWITPLQL